MKQIYESIIYIRFSESEWMILQVNNLCPFYLIFAYVNSILQFNNIENLVNA